MSVCTKSPSQTTRYSVHTKSPKPPHRKRYVISVHQAGLPALVARSVSSSVRLAKPTTRPTTSANRVPRLSSRMPPVHRSACGAPKTRPPNSALPTSTVREVGDANSAVKLSQTARAFRGIPYLRTGAAWSVPPARTKLTTGATSAVFARSIPTHCLAARPSPHVPATQATKETSKERKCCIMIQSTEHMLIYGTNQVFFQIKSIPQSTSKKKSAYCAPQAST